MKRLVEFRITVKGRTMRFNLEATRWLGMFLDTDLQFQAHENITLEKAKQKEDRVRGLRLTYEL